MTRPLQSIARGAAALLFAAGWAAPSAAQGVDLGAAARAVLQARCAPCHGPASEDRKAVRGLADALDLAQLRAEWITPGDLEGSELWLTLTDPFDPMPPPDAKSGLPSPAELYVLREWIAQGGPDPAAAAVAPPAARAEVTAQSRWGRLHPLSVHFPIAFLMAAALAEVLARTERGAGLRTARRFLVQLGALGALTSVALGWLAAESERASRTLEIHRWLGVATAVAALVALVVSERAARSREEPRKGLLLALLGCALLAGAAGWFGGVLVWGTKGWI